MKTGEKVKPCRSSGRGPSERRTWESTYQSLHWGPADREVSKEKISGKIEEISDTHFERNDFIRLGSK